MPSDINRLLRQFDTLAHNASIQPVNKLKPTLDLLAAISALFQDHDWEVNRDLFDGVSNETRRLVLAGFVSKVSDFFVAADAAVAIASLCPLSDDASTGGPTGHAAIDEVAN